VQQKAEFVLWYTELKSVVTVQHKWWRLHPGEKAPDDKTESLVETVQRNGKCCETEIFTSTRNIRRELKHTKVRQKLRPE
jgi:hypothetical protein